MFLLDLLYKTVLWCFLFNFMLIFAQHHKKLPKWRNFAQSGHPGHIIPSINVIKLFTVVILKFVALS